MNELVALLQTAADSALAGEIGTDVALFASSWALFAFGLVNKFLTDGAIWVLNKVKTLNAALQSGVALVFAFGLNYAISHFNLPLVSADLQQLPLIFSTLATWGLSMGYHGFIKKVIVANLPKTTA